MSSLTGRRGWTTVVSLTAVLGGLVTAQLPSASASADPAAVVRQAAGAADVDGVRLSRRPTSLTRAAALPVVTRAVPVAAAPVRPAAAPVRTTAAPVRPAAAPVRTTAAPTAARPAARPTAATAPAPAATSCSGAGWQQRRGQAALASLRGGTGRAGYAVVFAPARSGYLGLTHLDAKRIEMFVRTCERQSTELLRHVMAHELGHAHDTELMSTAKRAEWLRVRGIPASTPWYGCSGCTDFATPAGDFAEVYAQWARGAATNRSQLAGDVPAAQLAALASRFLR